MIYDIWHIYIYIYIDDRWYISLYVYMYWCLEVSCINTNKNWSHLVNQKASRLFQASTTKGGRPPSVYNAWNVEIHHAMRIGQKEEKRWYGRWLYVSQRISFFVPVNSDDSSIFPPGQARVSRYFMKACSWNWQTPFGLKPQDPNSRRASTRMPERLSESMARFV